MLRLNAKLSDSLFRALVLAFAIVASGCVTKQVKQAEVERVVEYRPVALNEAQRGEYRLALEDIKQSKFTSAKDRLQALLKALPNLAEGYINLGLMELKHGKLDDALQFLQDGLRYNPKSVQGLVLLAQVQLELRDYASAEANYIKALSYDPTALYAHYGLGVIYDLYLRDYEKAEAHYQRFLDYASGVESEQNIKRVQVWKKLLDRKAS